MDYIQIFTTIDDRKIAEKISDAILEKRLAACIQIEGPVMSGYWWLGKIQKSSEWRLVIKTRKDLFSKIEKEIKKYHSYKNPEIISISVNGTPEYLDWIEQETD